MAPLEPWEKVLVGEEFLTDTHSMFTCIECHGGQQDDDKAIAHEGFNPRPSEDSRGACGSCHTDQVANFAESLHASQEGYWTQIEMRGGDREHGGLQEMFGNHCASCHTSCGDCHVSQPTSVGGGLIEGHVFRATPSMTRNCTACHGSRVGNEYMGKNEDVQADVHFRQGRMVCVDCHTGAEMHGEQGVEDHRYAGPELPACVDCHAETASGEGSNMYHNLHTSTVSCQVCHSVSYTSCDSCHVSISEETGRPRFETQGTYSTFFIGLNPYQSEERPYTYVLLRHIPVDPESFAFYGEDLMPNFDAAPTWTYTTPHNIQLQTPQNSSCDACHGNADIFLTSDKIAENELEANRDVYVETLPEGP